MADPNNSTPATPTIPISSTDPPIPLVALTSGQLPLKLTLQFPPHLLILPFLLLLSPVVNFHSNLVI
jgi:hypothetical protein